MVRSDVRRLTQVAAAAAAVAAVVPPASAAPSPQELVLRQGDVPAGFRLDPAESGVRSNAREIEATPRLRPLFARWGRVTGYEVAFERKSDSSEIDARADLFRRAAGARSLLAWYDRELRKASPVALRRDAVAIGSGGWVYTGTAVTVVVWHSGRVFAGVSGAGEVTKARTLALARAQQRRIAAALR